MATNHLMESIYGLSRSLVCWFQSGDKEKLQLGYFIGLQGEVQVRSTISIPFPEQKSNVALYVNGQSSHSVSGVYEGKHLIQVLCPNDPIQNFWIDVKQKKEKVPFLIKTSNGMNCVLLAMT